jgi:penicillin-binding protein 1C
MPIPSFSKACNPDNQNTLDFIYPQKNTEIIIPRDFNKQKEKILLEATHTNKEATMYWHLDNQFIGETREIHELSVDLTEGKHVLMIMDQDGNSNTCKFKIYE